MRKYLIIPISIILTGIFLQSCCTEKRCQRKYPPQEITKDCTTTKTTQRDSTVIKHDTTIIPADSSYYYLWLECLDGSKPIIVDSESHQGNRINTNISYNKGKITVISKEDILKIVKAYNEKHTITTTSKERIKIETKIVNTTTNILKWWQKVLIWVGALSLIYWTVVITIFIVKKKYLYLLR